MFYVSLNALLIGNENTHVSKTECYWLKSSTESLVSTTQFFFYKMLVKFQEKDCVFISYSWPYFVKPYYTGKYKAKKVAVTQQSRTPSSPLRGAKVTLKSEYVCYSYS